MKRHLAVFSLCAAFLGCPSQTPDTGATSSSSGAGSVLTDAGVLQGTSSSSSSSGGATSSLSTVGSSASQSNGSSGGDSSSMLPASGTSAAASMATFSSSAGAVVTSSSAAVSAGGSSSSGATSGAVVVPSSSGGTATSSNAGASSQGSVSGNASSGLAGVSSSSGPRGVGAPCSPEACDTGLICVGGTPDTAFCQPGCMPSEPDAGCGAGTLCTSLAARDAGYCEPGASKGELCATTPCLGGLKCVGVNSNPSRCFDACTTAAGTCPTPGEICDPLGAAGQGFCHGTLPDPPDAGSTTGSPDGGAFGQACAPEPCQTGLICIGSNNDDALCETTCSPGSMSGDCSSGRFCQGLSNVDAGYCKLGAQLGEACSPPSCFPGLICVTVGAAASTCYQSCVPGSGTCPGSLQCLSLGAPGLGYCGTP